jgi:hypothetical protein
MSLGGCLIAKPHDKLQHDVQSYNHKVGPAPPQAADDYVNHLDVGLKVPFLQLYKADMY